MTCVQLLGWIDESVFAMWMLKKVSVHFIFVPKMHDLDPLQLSMAMFILSNFYSTFSDVH